MNDDYGDETELEIILALGAEEAENFGGKGMHGKPAKWLNPPHKIEPPHE
jgi:hypothetical protein